MTNELQISDSDFSEMLIKYMTRDAEVFRRCQEMKLVGDDFMVDYAFGNEVYREFVNTINHIGRAPIIQDTLLRHIKTKIDDGNIEQKNVESVIEFFGFIYDTPVDDPSFILTRLPGFLMKHRTNKVMLAYQDDPAALTTQLNQIKFQIDTATSSDGVKVYYPFRDLIFKTQSRLIGTQITKLDDKIKGLLLGEYALLVGFSGGGKSTVGTNIVCNCAEIGMNSSYISCEETHDNMAQRFYSKAYRIPYAALRGGTANYELEAKKAEYEAKMGNNLANCLNLISVKGVTDITPDFLHSKLVHQFEETGFVPTIVMLDQMQFISPNTTLRRSAGAWEVEKLVSAELDELSHKTVGGRNFILWVQHQARGKLKKRFTREDIDGFKGIIHKADLAIGLGKDDIHSNEIDLFSLKVRHTGEFGITIRANFEFMDVSSEVPDIVAAELTQAATTNPVDTNAVAVELPKNPMAQHV